MNRKKIIPFLKIGSLGLFLFFFSFSLFAEEEAEEKTGSEVVVVPHVSVSQVIDYHTRDLESRASDIGLYESPIYLRTNIKAFFDIKKGNFAFSPFFQERLESFLGKAEIPINMTESNVSAQIRNRFYFGFDLKYDIKDLMNIKLSNEFRIASNLQNSNSSSPDLEFRFAPIISLSGNYSFGLTWSCYQLFGVIFNKDSINNGGNPLASIYFEGDISLSYEFLHHLPDLKDQKAFVFANFTYGYTDFLNPTTTTYSLNSDFSVGLKYSHEGITPAMGMHVWSDHDITLDKMVGLGLYLGINYKIDKFTVNVVYIGGEDIISPDFHWESRVSTSVTYSL